MVSQFNRGKRMLMHTHLLGLLLGMVLVSVMALVETLMHIYSAQLQAFSVCGQERHSILAVHGTTLI